MLMHTVGCEKVRILSCMKKTHRNLKHAFTENIGREYHLSQLGTGTKINFELLKVFELFKILDTVSAIGNIGWQSCSSTVN